MYAPDFLHEYILYASSGSLGVTICVAFSFQLSEEGPCEDLSSDGQLSSFNEWILPAKEFDGMWERFVFIIHF